MRYLAPLTLLISGSKTFAGRPVVHHLELEELVHRASAIAVVKMTANLKTGELNGCETHKLSLELGEVLKPPKGQNLPPNIELVSNGTSLKDCSMRKLLGGTGASFAVTAFQDGLDAAALPVGSSFIVFLHWNGKDWILLADGAFVNLKKRNRIRNLLRE